MEFDVRSTFVDFDLDATIDPSSLTDFHYVSKGGFALVFAARMRRADGGTQNVAVKVLKPENHFRPSNYSKFLQEVAFQTALPHPFIVRALGFCSVPVSQLITAAPASVLVPNGKAAGNAASAVAGKAKKAATLEWFSKRRLHKCWALVLEFMSDGSMFDQVLAAARRTGERAAGNAQQQQQRPQPGMAAAAGGYSDAQGLLWLIDVADAMTHLHSRLPLLIHRDLKLENILLRRESDGMLRAKLSDFGLTAAIDAAGRKVPPPQVLRAPGQSLEDVCGFPSCPRKSVAVPAPLATAPAGSGGPDRPAAVCSGAVRELSTVLATGGSGPLCEGRSWPNFSPRAPGLNGAFGRRSPGQQAAPHEALPGSAPAPLLQPGLSRKAQSSSQVQMPDLRAPAPPGRSPWPGEHCAATGGEAVAAADGRGQFLGCHLGAAAEVGAAGRRALSAAQAHLGVFEGRRAGTVPAPDSEAGGGAGGGAAQNAGQDKRSQAAANAKRQVDGTGQRPSPSPPPLRPERSAVSWTGTTRLRRGGDGGADGGGGCRDAAGGGCKASPADYGGLLWGGSPLAAWRASSSRMSETGYRQIKMEQLNGLLQMGVGHRDYLPDMYQMTFKLTSQCGSVCYMAPEVARQLPYNQKADVFAFGCIMYEIMTRQLLSDSIPEGDVNAAMEYLGRVAWSGWRPDLPTSMSKELRLLISLCWHREPRLRPSFPTIAKRLREVLLATAMPPLITQSSLVAPTASETPRQAQPLPRQQLLQWLKRQQLQLAQQLQQVLNQNNQVVQAQQQQKLLLQLSPEKLAASCQNATNLQMAAQMSPGAYWNGNGTTNASSNMWNAYPAAAIPGPPTGTANGAMSPVTGGAAAAMVASLSSASSSALQPGQTGGLHRQQQQQLALQMQLEQLNACTRAGSACAAAAAGVTSPTAFQNPPSPYTVYSAGSQMPSLFESGCTNATYVTAGCRISSPVLGALQPSVPGRGALSVEAATAHPGRVIGTQQVSDGGWRSSLPSPVSPNGSRGDTRRSSGAQPGLEVSRATVSKSDCSGGTHGAASLTPSFRNARGGGVQAVELGKAQRPGQGQEGCMSMCVLM